MRLLLAAGLLAAVGLAQAGPAAAQEKVTYPWCSTTSGVGSTQCTHPSFNECQYDVQGIGGVCVPNGAYNGNPGGPGTEASPPPQ